jgi:hypothetical protein
VPLSRLSAATPALTHIKHSLFDAVVAFDEELPNHLFAVCETVCYKILAAKTPAPSSRHT